MRKKRQKALKLEFQRATGALPNGMLIVYRHESGAVAYVPSAWRRLKKSYLQEKSNG